MQINLTQVVVALIGLLSTALTSFLIPFLKNKISEAKYKRIQVWTTVAVEAAEQIFVGTGLGAKKKEYVMNFLSKRGYKIDDDELDVVIESAVLEMKHAIAG